MTSDFKAIFAGNLEANDIAIRGSTEKAVLAYSVHFSELIFSREYGLSLYISCNLEE